MILKVRRVRTTKTFTTVEISREQLIELVNAHGRLSPEQDIKVPENARVAFDHNNKLQLLWERSDIEEG